MRKKKKEKKGRNIKRNWRKGKRHKEKNQESIEAKEKKINYWEEEELIPSRVWGQRLLYP
jgi:hypothetical protein